MTSYPESANIEIEVPILDAQGKPFSESCTAKYALFDVDEKKLFEGQIESATSKVSISIPAEHNKVPLGQAKDARSLVVSFVKSDGNTVSESKVFYLLNSKQPLVVGTNSFVTLDKCRLLATTLPKMEHFNKASEDEIIVALTTACSKLQNYRYRMTTSSRMDNIAYISEFADKPRSVCDCLVGGGTSNLKGMTPETFVNLPKDFRDALAKAQVIEANAVLAPTDDILERRQKGVILETINEVKMMFANTAPVRSNVSTEALTVLSPWLVRSVLLRRV